MANTTTTSVIVASVIAPATPAQIPHRVVLRHMPDNQRTPFVVHTESHPGEPRSGFSCGEYCETLQEALRFFFDRCDRYSLAVSFGEE
jgi:hypothetical protein